MTRQKILAQAAKIREIVKVWYAKEGPKMVRETPESWYSCVSKHDLSHGR